MTITLADILAQIEDFEPIDDPFNGATELNLAPDLAAALGPTIASAPFGMPKVSVSKELRPGHGYGWRPAQPGDDDLSRMIGRTCVWLCAPKGAADR